TLQFFSVKDFELVARYGISSSSVTRILWHPKIDQIIVGTGKGDNSIRVYYEIGRSTKGALLCAGKSRKKKRSNYYTNALPVHNPHSLPMFNPEMSSKKKKLKDRRDPIKPHNPNLPTQGPGYGYVFFFFSLF